MYECFDGVYVCVCNESVCLVTLDPLELGFHMVISCYSGPEPKFSAGVVSALNAAASL